MNSYLEKIAKLSPEQIGKVVSNAKVAKETYDRRKKKKKKFLEAKSRRFSRGTVRKNT